MRIFRFATLFAATPILGFAGCGGEPAKAPVADLLAIAPAPAVAVRPAPAAAVLPSEPPILFALKIAHPAATFATGKGWLPAAMTSGAELREFLDSVVRSWLPNESVALDRPMSLFVVANGSSEDTLFGLPIARRELVTTRFPHAKTVADGVLELERNSGEDDDDMHTGTPSKNDTNGSTDVCWMGAPVGMPDLVLCGKRRSVRICFDYYMQVHAPKSIPADMRIEVHGPPLTRMLGRILSEGSFKRDMAKLSGPFSRWMADQATEATLAVAEFGALTLDVALEAETARADLTLEMNDRKSWIGAALASAPPSQSAGAPPELLRMPADASELSFLRGGSGVSAAFVAQLIEGLKALGGSAWSASDLSKLEAVQLGMARLASAAGAVAAGIDLDKLPALVAPAAFNPKVPQRPAQYPAAAKSVPQPTYQVTYLDVPMGETQQILADLDALLGSPTARLAIENGVSKQFGGIASIPSALVPRIIPRAKNKPLAQLPAGAVAYELQLGAASLLGVSGVLRGVDTGVGTLLVAPLGAGTVSVYSPIAEVALAKLRVVLAGGAGTLAQAPNSAALVASMRGLQGGQGALFTPRSVARMLLDKAPNSRRSSGSSGADRIAALRTPAAFVPMTVEVLPTSAAQPAAGSRVVLRAVLPRAVAITGADWMQRGLFP